MILYYCLNIDNLFAPKESVMENTMLNGIVFSPVALVAFWLITGAILALLAIVGLHSPPQTK